MFPRSLLAVLSLALVACGSADSDTAPYDLAGTGGMPDAFGGAASTGGSPATVGGSGSAAVSTGGAPASGGSVSTGGTPTAATGGATPLATGGTTSTGGVTATGGVASTGGAPSPGNPSTCSEAGYLDPVTGVPSTVTGPIPLCRCGYIGKNNCDFEPHAFLRAQRDDEPVRTVFWCEFPARIDVQRCAEALEDARTCCCAE